MPYFTLRPHRSRRSAAASPPVVPGYDLLRELDRGRRSRVYLATPHDSPQPLLDRVVVKLYDAQAGEGALQMARFWQSLDSPHCPQFLDEKRTPTSCAIVSPWLRCGSLAELLARRHSTLRLGEATTILAPLAQLLQAVHERGGVHGALQTCNVLFDHIGRPVLVGWGATNGEADTGSENDPLDDAIQFVSLCREVLAACDGANRATASFVTAESLLTAESFLTAELVELRRESRAVHGTRTDRVPDQSLLKRFFEAAEDALFSLAEPCPIDPLQPYDWAADATTALARVDAEIDTMVAENTEARRPMSRLRAAIRSATDGVTAAGHHIARDRRVRLWPGHRGSIRLKTVAVAALVGSVALTGALLATPASSVTATPAHAAQTIASSNPASSAAATTRDTDSPIQPRGEAASGGDANGDANAEAVVASDDAVAALAVLVSWREECLLQPSADCFGAVDQPQSAALASDQSAFAETKRLGATAGTSWLNITSDTGAVAQRVGNAVLTTVLVGGEPGSTDAATKTPASALLVKGETGWRIREIFTPPG